MIDDKLQEYAEKFGDGFPMIPLAWGRTEEQLIEIINNCLESGKDVYEMGLLQEDDDIDY